MCIRDRYFHTSLARVTLVSTKGNVGTHETIGSCCADGHSSVQWFPCLVRDQELRLSKDRIREDYERKNRLQICQMRMQDVATHFIDTDPAPKASRFREVIADCLGQWGEHCFVARTARLAKLLSLAKTVPA